MEVVYYGNKVEKFVYGLNDVEAGKILRAVRLLMALGNQLRLPHSKYIERDLNELRASGDSSVRILYTFHNNNLLFF